MNDSSDNGNSKFVQVTSHSGEAIWESLRQAAVDRRLICGAYDVGVMLQQCPQDVMLCIIPQKIPPDSSLHININLIDAFCLENGVRKIKVDDFDKLVKMLPVIPGNDFSCIILKYPRTQYSDADKTLLQYYDMICDRESDSEPIVELPEMGHRPRVNTM